MRCPRAVQGQLRERARAGAAHPRGSGRGHLARATLEGIAHQVADVVEAMVADSGRELSVMKVDGGAAANDLLMSMQADALGAEVSRSATLETTAFGAGFLAGLAVGFWESPSEVSERWRENGRFRPDTGDAERTASREVWRSAVKRVSTQG